MSQTGSLAVQSDNAEALPDSPGTDLFGIKPAGISLIRLVLPVPGIPVRR
jgi:hypothetical protein